MISKEWEMWWKLGCRVSYRILLRGIWQNRGMHGWLNEAVPLAWKNEWYLGDDNSHFGVHT